MATSEELKQQLKKAKQELREAREEVKESKIREKLYLERFSGVTIKSLVDEIPALVEEYMRQEKIYYQASKDWLEVMSKLYGGMYAVYEQHYFSEHADVEVVK